MFAEHFFTKPPIELGIDFIGVGGHGNYLPFVRIAEALRIPFFILSDGEDAVKKSVKKTLDRLYNRNVDPMELLETVNLKDKAKAKVKELSGGQKQRFSVATTLINEPRIIFLDEPTTGLDPQARRSLWELVKNIRQRGTTVIITTHYMDEAEYLCDRVAIIDSGNIIALDTPDKLIDNLIATGFERPKEMKLANLEDVFIKLTGHSLRED